MSSNGYPVHSVLVEHFTDWDEKAVFRAPLIRLGKCILDNMAIYWQKIYIFVNENYVRYHMIVLPENSFSTFF